MTIGRQSDYMSTNSPPKQTVLERLHKKSISAKDIASQFWCEKQMELNYIHGVKFTAAMDKGMAIHQQMQDQVYRPLVVEAQTYPDRMYKTAYENILTLSTLMERGIAREFKIYGALNGYCVVGQIDELRIDNGKVVIVENKTTSDPSSFNPQFTKPHQVQTMLYRKLLDDMRSGSYQYQNLDVYYKLSSMKISENFAAGLRTLGIKDEMMSVQSIYLSMFDKVKTMPELSNSLIIHYVSRNNSEQTSNLVFDYSRESLNADISYAMKYWTAQREAQPVSQEESWKCKYCRFFGNECKTWWKG